LKAWGTNPTFKWQIGLSKVRAQIKEKGFVEKALYDYVFGRTKSIGILTRTVPPKYSFLLGKKKKKGEGEDGKRESVLQDSAVDRRGKGDAGLVRF